ncbi:MAG: glycosyltransferase family 4 protein, partial [Anaerolineales bacterium]|nr:glycosyltransferase family 4 protein [Anaerolineales bacterium]
RALQGGRGKMMRVALASIHPRPLSGQIESLVGLAHALQERGNSVQVVSAFPSEDLLGANRNRLARQSRRVFFDQPARMTRILAQLVRLATRVDVIQLNLPTPAFAIYADLLQTLVRVPVIVGYEAHLVRARDLLRRNQLFAAPDFYFLRLLINNHLLARMTLRRAAGYLVNTEYQKAELISLGVAPTRIHLLPPVLPQDKLTRVPRETVRPQFPLGRLVTFIGHYNHVKGVDVLIRAFRLLAPRVPEAQLVLAWSGIGSDRRVKELLTDRALAGRVIQLGQVRVPELLSASDVVALPYRLTIGQAACPATLLEVCAANVPLVTSDLPLLRELTGDGKTALLVPPDDPDALAAAIERVLNEPTLVSQMLAAQCKWIQQIEPSYAAQNYEQVYEQIITNQARVLRPAPDRE